MRREGIKLTLLRYGFVFLVTLLLGLMQRVNAQAKEWEIPKYNYTGMEVSAGAKTITYRSTVDELDGRSLIAVGGNAGVIVGNTFSRFFIKPLGFYSELGFENHNMNLYAFEVENNTFLLRNGKLKSSRFDLFSILGLGYNSQKFFGQYSNHDNHIAVQNPEKHYTAKIESLMMTAGIGLEYQLSIKDGEEDFLSLFLNTKYGIPMQISTGHEAFERTETISNFDLSFGVRFGFMKSNMNFHRRI